MLTDMKFTDLPDEAGVYLFMDRAFNVIYIGKAKSIRKRVRSHFGKDNLDTKHISMITQVKTIDYITTRNEKEALALEEKLIKSIKPRYNVIMRDDKSYPFLEITAYEDYPALKVTRSKKRNLGSYYFGPFPNARDVRFVLKITDRIFRLRKCRKFSVKDRPCLNYQIKKCYSPCTGGISRDVYEGIVEEIRMFLSGKYRKLLAVLKKRMVYFKERREYEEAARIRDQIRDLEGFFPIVSFRKINRKKLDVLKKVDPSYLLKDILGMKVRPRFIEGYDISHTSSKEAVGGMVAFKDGQPDKSRYRKYKIKQSETADDIKMIEEVVYRRLRALLSHKKRLPDLLLIDGGRGQESAVRRIVEYMNLKNLKVLSLAKENERVYSGGKVLKIDTGSEVFKLLKRITDEAHRFAHSYHASRRKKKLLC